MKSSFSNPSWGGVTNEVEQPRPDTENRSWGEFAKDVAIDALASPLVGAARAGTQLWRSAEDTPGSTAETVDKALGGAQEWLQEQRSDRARALDTQSIDPRGDERSFWKEPIAGSVHALLPSIPYAAAAIGTAGTGLLAEGATAIGMGALQAGDAVNDMRDYADRTPLADLQKSPVFQDLWRKFNGDEGAARNALFKEMLDPKSLALNWLVNTFEVPAFRLGMRPSGAAMRIVDRAKAAGIGAAVGGTQGAIEGGAQAYEEQVGKVRSGQQQAIDTDEIAGAMLGGATMGGPMAAFHAVAPTYKATKIGTDTTAVAADQLNPDRAGGVPPPGAQPPGPPAGGVGTAPPGGQRAAINPEGATAPLPQRQPVEEAAAPPEAPPAPPPAPTAPRPPPDNLNDAVTIFKTGKGSEYFQFDDGTTVRNKAPRPEHPGDQGWQDQSQQTVFVSPEHANELGGLFQAESRSGKRIIVTPSGMVGVQYTSGPSAGKVERRTYGRALSGPVEGATPVELWNNGRTAHFGNPITQVVHRYGEEVGPHEPVGPNLPAPPRMPPGRMVWSSETGFTQPVSVMDRPPVYQDGRWMQPVAYTNPRTGRTEMHLAPQDELLQEHGPPDARPPEVPVRTPERPLAPQFPEIERPGLPTERDFPQERPAQERPVQEPGTPLEQLRQQYAEQQTQEQEVEASTERARQRRINLERAERMPEVDWRDVRPPDRGLPRPGEGRTPLERALRVAGERVRREKQPLRTVGERLRQQAELRRREAAAERRGAAYEEMQQRRGDVFLQERVRSAVRRSQYERAATEHGRAQAAQAREREEERKKAAEKLPRTHPLMGGELRNQTLRQLKADVDAYNARVLAHTSGREVDNTLGHDRAQLQERIDNTRNADLLDLELLEPEKIGPQPQTRSEAERSEFGRIAKELGEMASRGELMRRAETLGKNAPHPLETRNGYVPNSKAVELVRQLENINYARGKGVIGRRPQLGLPEALYNRLVAAGLVRTQAQIEADRAQSALDSAAIKEAMRRRIDAELAQRGQATDSAAIKRLARRMRNQANINAPTMGLSSYLSKKHRDEWEAKSPADKRRLRQVARVQSLREQEDLIREEVAKREAEARARIESGKPPLQERTTIAGTSDQPFFGKAEMQKLPTVEEAIRQWREGMRAIKETRRVGTAVTEMRGARYADRERTVRETIAAAIKKRFPGKNSEKKLLDLIDRLAKVPARPPVRPRGLNPNMYDRMSAEQKERYKAWEDAVDKWLTEKEKQVGPDGDATKLKDFLDRTIQNIHNEIEAYKKRNNITGREPANLPTARWNDDMQRFTFHAGTNEARFDYYNFANDLQKMSENLRAMRVALGLQPQRGSDTAVPLSTRILRSIGPRRTFTAGGRFHAVGQPQMMTYLNEFQRAVHAALGEQLQDFRVDMRQMMAGNMEPIRIRREGRVEEFTQARGLAAPEGREQYEAETELPAKSEKEQVAEEAHALAEQQKEEEISGGSLAALSGRNVVEQRTIERIAQQQSIESKQAELAARQAGQVYDPRAVIERTKSAVEREFPIRWTYKGPNINKVRRGMDPRAFEDELRSPGRPDHPAISPVESPYGTLDRVKDMVAKGQTGVVPREYVTDEFLDRLAAINRGTEVYHAPAVGEQPAYYDTALDRVVLPSDASPDLYVRSALHENVHAATERSLLTDPAFRGEVNDLMQLGINAARRAGHDLDNLPRDLYGLTNPSEFIAEMASNQKFREFLFRVPAPHNEVIQGVKNVLNAAYRAIQKALRKVFGNAKDGDTALDILFYDQSTVLGQADALFKRKLEQLSREGRPDRSAAINRLGEDDGRRYLNLSEGARAFRDGLRGMFDRAAFSAGEANKVLQGGSPSVGMAWRTMDQMTRVGSPEFRALSRDLYAEFERMHGDMTRLRDADIREIADLARIWNSWNEEGRIAAGGFIIDEGMHTAHADAPLGERKPSFRNMETGEMEPGERIGKNKHIEATAHPDGTYTADNLRDEQVVYQHAAMEQRLRDMEQQLPEFGDFRRRIYKMTEQREEQIRHDNIRNMWAATDFIPQNMEPKALDRLLDAFLNWTDPDLKLQSGDRAVLDNALNAAGFTRGITDPKVISHRDEIRKERSFQKLEGPYSPFDRVGEWALTGRMNIEKPANALVLKEDVNEATGQPIDDARFVFRTDAEARQAVHDITDKYGVAQLEGGKVWIDTRTGERPRLPDARHDGKERLATNAEIERYQDATERKKNPEMAKLLDPKHVKEHSYVTFQPTLLTMHPTQYEAHKAQQAFNQHFNSQGEERLSLSDPMDALKHDARQNDQYTTTHMQGLINFVRSQAAFQRMDRNEQADLTRTFNLAQEKFIRRKGIMQRYLPRNYVKGANENVLESAHNYSLTSTRYLGKARHASQIKTKSDAMKQYLKETRHNQGDRNSLAEQRVYNSYMRRIHNPTRNPHANVVSKTLDRAMRFTVLKKLPSLKYLTNNGTETALIGGPVLIGRHGTKDTYKTIWKFYKLSGTFTRFAKAAGNDLKQAWKNTGKMTNFLDLFHQTIDAAGSLVRYAEGTKDALTQAAARNIFDRTASLEYTSSLRASQSMIDKMLDFGQRMFQAMNTAVENNGRFTMISSAYELERGRLERVAAGQAKALYPGEASLTEAQRHQAAVDYAIDSAHKANGVYANYNAPEMFTREGPLGILGPMVFQFKKWPQRITMLYLNSGLGFVKGLVDLARDGQMTPEHKEMARTFGVMLAMTGLVAGALGMPTEPLSTTVNAGFIMGLWKFNWDDVEAGFRAWMAKHGGREMSQMVAHGPLSYLTGIDFASGLSQSQMWAFGSPASNKPHDLYASLMGLMGGATLSSLTEVGTGFQNLAEATSAYRKGADEVAGKKFMEFARHIAPVRAFADALSSFSDSEGTELASGRKLGKPYTAGEQAARALGFTPTRQSEAREARQAITSYQKRVETERKSYIDAFAQTSSGLQREQIWQAIQSQWNPAHPGAEITRDDLLKARGTRQKAQAEPREQLGIPQGKRTRALMPMAEAYGYR